MEQTKEVNKSNIGTIGWVLFIIGIFLMFNSLGNFIFYVPIFLTTFIIAIILITRKQVGSGISLLLLTLILPPILSFGLFAYNVGETMNTIEKEKQAESQDKIRDIKFEEVKIFDRGNYMYCEGKVRNTGSRSFDYIKVKVEWLDKNSTIIDTDYTFAVSGEGLAPREAKSFNIMTPSDPKMKSGRYYIIE